MKDVKTNNESTKFQLKSLNKTVKETSPPPKKHRNSTHICHSKWRRFKLLSWHSVSWSVFILLPLLQHLRASAVLRKEVPELKIQKWEFGHSAAPSLRFRKWTHAACHTHTCTHTHTHAHTHKGRQGESFSVNTILTEKPPPPCLLLYPVERGKPCKEEGGSCGWQFCSHRIWRT